MLPNLAFGDIIDLGSRTFFIASALLCILTRKCKFLRQLCIYGKQLDSAHESYNHKYTVDKRYFIHFYALAIFLNGLLTIRKYQLHRNVGVVQLLFQIHVIRRFLEQLLLFNKIKKNSRMHVLAYFFGLCYYVVVPLTLYNVYPRAYSISLIPMNLFAQGIQAHAHYHLYTLNSKDPVTGKPQYKVPTSVEFSMVLCPHYLAEILFYMTLACNTSTILCVVFVSMELSVLALEQKAWYLSKFPGNLPTTYAIFPALL